MLYNPKWEDSPSVEDKPLEPWQQKLLEAANYIDKHGWCQNKFGNGQGKVCMLGAISRVESYWRTHNNYPAYEKLCNFLGKSPMGWNDTPGRTQEEVTRALRECARKG